MYIKIAKEKSFSQFCLCVKVNFRISILEDFAFLTPAGTSLLLLQLRSALSCWTAIQIRTLLLLEKGPDPKGPTLGSGSLFPGVVRSLCSRLAGSVPKSLHTPPPCNKRSSTWSRVIRGPDLVSAQQLAS